MGSLNDGTTMGEEIEPEMREEAKEEASDEPTHDLGRAIADAKRNCATEKEKKLQRMLEDHKKLLYPNCEADKKSWAPHWNCCNGRQRMVYLTRDLKSCW